MNPEYEIDERTNYQEDDEKKEETNYQEDNEKKEE